MKEFPGVFPVLRKRGDVRYEVRASVGGEHRYLGVFGDPETAMRHLIEERRRCPPPPKREWRSQLEKLG